LEQYPNAARTVKLCACENWQYISCRKKKAFEKYPLHVACQNLAPLYVIQALIKVWPAGMVEAPAGNCWPLHKACTCAKSLPTIQLLVDAYPELVQQCTTDNDGYLPLDLALMSPDVSLDIICFLVQQ